MERLTPLSAWFLQAEDEDPTNSLPIGSTAIFEGPAPTHREFVQHIAGRLSLVPRYRQVVRQLPLDIGPPVWVDHPDTDVEWHIRRTALPAPGGEAELHRLIARVMSTRMDRTRPLWEYWVVEGLEGGRWAVLQKVHHCVLDGVSGSALYQVVYDTSRETRPNVPDDWQPRPAPSTLALTAEAVRDLAMYPVDIAKTVGAVVRSPLTLTTHAVATARGAIGLLARTRPAQSSSLWGPLSRQRRYTSVTVSLKDIKSVRRALGCSVNDVALAAITGGFRALLLSRGEEPHARAVRTLVPVNVRGKDQEGIADNRVSIMLPRLPVDLTDPVERIDTIRQRIMGAVRGGEPMAATAFTTMGEDQPYMPVALGVRMAIRIPQRHVVTVTTNVPGPPRPIYALGRKCERMLPFVPVAERLRIGVAMFSYVDTFSFGITGDYDTTPDIRVLATGIRDSMAELLDAAKASG